MSNTFIYTPSLGNETEDPCHNVQQFNLERPSNTYVYQSIQTTLYILSICIWTGWVCWVFASRRRRHRHQILLPTMQCLHHLRRKKKKMGEDEVESYFRIHRYKSRAFSILLVYFSNMVLFTTLLLNQIIDHLPCAIVVIGFISGLSGLIIHFWYLLYTNVVETYFARNAAKDFRIFRTFTSATFASSTANANTAASSVIDNNIHERNRCTYIGLFYGFMLGFLTIDELPPILISHLRNEYVLFVILAIVPIWTTLIILFTRYPILHQCEGCTFIFMEWIMSMLILICIYEFCSVRMIQTLFLNKTVKVIRWKIVLLSFLGILLGLFLGFTDPQKQSYKRTFAYLEWILYFIIHIPYAWFIMKYYREVMAEERDEDEDEDDDENDMDIPPEDEYHASSSSSSLCCFLTLDDFVLDDRGGPSSAEGPTSPPLPFSSSSPLETTIIQETRIASSQQSSGSGQVPRKSKRSYKGGGHGDYYPNKLSPQEFVAFEAYLQEHHAVENLYFVEDADMFKAEFANHSRAWQEHHRKIFMKTYIDVDAPLSVNISHRVQMKLKSMTEATETMFEEARNEVRFDILFGLWMQFTEKKIQLLAEV